MAYARTPGEHTKRNVTLLATCQALFMTCTTLLVTTSALVGIALAPNAALATVPLGMQFLAMMATALPASLLMRRIGRRNGLMVGLLIWICGALAGATAIVIGNFVLFATASGLLGIHNGFCQFYRFAAADVARSEYRSRAIALVMAGGVVAAFTGPGLALATRDLSMVPFAASYASLSVLQLISAVLLLATRIPPSAYGASAGGHSSLRLIAVHPAFLAAVVCAMIGYGSMNLLMTATPLAMRDAGFEFAHTTQVIQWHVFGMFAASFITGQLIARYGADRIIATGAAFIAFCVAVNLIGSGLIQFWLALALLGVGWSFMFVGATTAVTWACRAEEMAKVQGLNDVLVFATAAMTAVSSGALYHWLGWSNVNLIIVPALAVALVISLGSKSLSASPETAAGG